MPSNELWFSPDRMTFQSIHVRGNTEWIFFELGAADGTFGSAEITHAQLKSTVVPLAAKLASRLRGERVRSDSEILQMLGVTIDQCENDLALATAISGIRCAVSDALAKRAQLPMATYLRAIHNQPGHPGERVQLYANINRSMLPNDRGAVDRSPDAFAEMAERALKAGFATFKCAPFDECRAPFERPGLPGEAQIGLDRVRAVKKAIGADCTLYVDCHSRFDLESALELEPLLREAGGAWFEEPVDPIRDTGALRAIRAKSELPIAGAEMGYGVGAFRALLKDDVLDVVMPDVKYCGGPVEAYRIGVEFEPDAPGTVSMHCPSGPVSLLASAQATAAFGNARPLEHAVYEVEWRHEVMEPHERVVDGRFVIPEGYGLGGRVDPVAIELRGRRWEP